MAVGISLGWNCYPASWAVDKGIREKKAVGYMTCPFDECITNYDGILLCIQEDFKHFFDLELLVAPNLVGGIKSGERLLYNRRYKFIFNHESPDHAGLYSSQGWGGGPMHFIANDYKLFRERYERRIQNFRNYLTSGSEIKFIISKFDPDVLELEKALSENYPKLEFSVIHLVPEVTLENFKNHFVLMGCE
jgi:hypothetical protein